MATPPDFTNGTALDASSLNKVGLWRVGGGPLSGSTTQFVGCFTDDFENYRIVMSSLALSANADIYWAGLVGTTPSASADYSFAHLGLTAGNVQLNAANTASTLAYTGFTATGGVGGLIVGSLSMDIYGPKLAQRTFATSIALGYSSNFYGRQGMSHFNLSTAFNGIQFSTGGAPTMAGTVSIYGYRKA
jgi:hypothetical protein